MHSIVELGAYRLVRLTTVNSQVHFFISSIEISNCIFRVILNCLNIIVPLYFIVVSKFFSFAVPLYLGSMPRSFSVPY